MIRGNPKVRTLLTILRTLFTNPGRIRLVIDHEKEYFNHIKKHHPAFIHGLPVIDSSEFQIGKNDPTGKNDVIEPYTFLGGNSLPTDIALLRSLARQFKDCQYFEIGTWRGESVANIAPLAHHCTTLNLPDEEMQQMGLSENYVAMHRFFSRDLKNVTHIQHNSLSFNFAPYKNKMDLIFVDGDHHYPLVLSDTKNVFSLLQNESSIIVWHDYGFDPEQIRYEVLAGILDGCPADKRPYLYHVADTKCVLFTQKKFNTHILKPNQNPDNYFSVTLSRVKPERPGK